MNCFTIISIHVATVTNDSHTCQTLFICTLLKASQTVLILSLFHVIFFECSR